MNKKIKSRLASVGTAAVAAAMVMSLGAIPIAFAANEASNVSIPKYYSAYDNFEDVLHDGKDVNEQLAAEGFVLLKNNNAALPLASSERSVTLLGAESYQTQIGGGGSGTTSRPGGGNYSWVSSSASSLRSSLNDEGFTINPRIAARYGDGAGANGDRNTYMTPLTSGTGVVSFGGKAYDLAANNFLAGADDNIYRYGDAAIISFSRAGSEGEDNATHDAAGHSDTTEHYLTLNDSERQILAYAKYQKAQGNIKKIIVILNSPAVMELGDIEDDDAFDAMLWVGVTGWNGADAIGKILTGEYNPSGKTVDFWMRDFKTDPTWYGFGNYSQAAWELYEKYTIAANERGTNYGETLNAFGGTEVAFKAPTMHLDENSTLTETANAVTYSEGIFLGYKYYETVAVDLGDAGEAWYDEVTLYPFGYGLSYTSFEQKIVDVKGDLSNANGQVTVSVEVTNVGRKAGKDVVQLYSTPEYHEGEIDKAAVNLIGFEKTSLLQPRASETVNITVKVKELASFDYNDANYNDNSGYELEADDYVLSIRKNSHDVIDSRTLTANSLLTWDEDGNPSTPNNIYSQESGEWEMFNTGASHWTTSHNDNDLHRDALLNDAGDAPSDLTKLAWMLTDENNFSEEAFRVLQMRGNLDVGLDFDNITTATKETDYANIWAKTADDMAGLTQGAGNATNGLYAITIDEMAGLDYDDPKWDELLNQLTWQEMQTLLNDGAYHTVAVPTIGKPQLTDSDGPAQTGNNASVRGWGWVCEVVIASTWNLELAYRQGQIVGEETLWNPSTARTGGGIAWYGPAMNTHRNPLEGRTFEYYSQDGLQGGKIAAAVVKGATDKGARVYVKHAFLNDQETSRVDSCVLINEQALRETYAKQFEYTVREGNANGIMNSFNAIGLVPSTSYAICVQMYSNEWGYKGINVTDYWMESPSTGWNGYNMVRGLAIPLNGSHRSGLPTDYQVVSTWDETDNVVKVNGEASYTQWYWARETVKRLLYVHANSNGGYNGLISGKILKASTVSGSQYSAVDVDLVDKAYLDGVFGDAGYTVTVAGLPSGLSYNANTGHLAGTPTSSTSNNQSFTVSVRGNNGAAWISSSANFTMTIESAVQMPTLNENFTLGSAFVDGFYTLAYNTAAASEELTVSVDSSKYLFTEATEDHAVNCNPNFVMPENLGNQWIPSYSEDGLATLNANVNLFTSNTTTYTASGLPAGMSINQTTGAISGTPTVPGRYIVTVNAQATRLTMSQGFFGATWSNAPATFASTEICIVVEGLTATFDFNGGTLRVDNQDLSSQSVGFASGAAYNSFAIGTTPTRGDYTFLGWATTANATQPNVTNDTTYSANTTFYAVWEAPAVMMVDGELWINGQNTHISAVELTQGLNGADGKDGLDGIDGANGIGIQATEINDAGELVVTLTDGTSANLGKVVGEKGEDGENGTNGENGLKGADGSSAGAGAGIGLGVAGLVLGGGALGLALYMFLKKRKEQK